MTESVVIRDSGGGTFRDSSGAIAVFPGAVASVFGRTGAVAAAAGDYFGAMPAALTGATQAARFVGATTSGAPVSGTFAVGDVVVARDGHVFVCTSAGTPGTWVDVGAGASVSYATPSIVLGSSAAAGAASTVIRSDSTIAAFDATNPTTQAFGDAAAIGTAAFAARRDHKHAMPATPVTTINKTGSTALTGAVTLTGGTGVALTQSGQDISIAASGGGTTELDYVERTTDLGVTATSSASANSVIDGNAVSFNGTTRVKIEVGIARADFTNNCFVTLWDGSTDLGNIAVCGTAGAFAPTAPLYGARFLTPSNASHTFHIKAWKTSGTTNIYGAIANALPVWYRITVA